MDGKNHKPLTLDHRHSRSHLCPGCGKCLSANLARMGHPMVIWAENYSINQRVLSAFTAWRDMMAVARRPVPLTYCACVWKTLLQSVGPSCLGFVDHLRRKNVSAAAVPCPNLVPKRERTRVLFLLRRPDPGLMLPFERDAIGATWGKCRYHLTTTARANRLLFTSDCQCRSRVSHAVNDGKVVYSTPLHKC